VTEVTSVHSAMSCDFPWPCSLGETSKTNAYSNSRDRNTRRQDFGRKKKKNTGASLSEETVVISVRENELILQRAQKGNPEAQSSLRACRGKRFAPALRILPMGQDAMGIEKFHNSVERI